MTWEEARGQRGRLQIAVSMRIDGSLATIWASWLTRPYCTASSTSVTTKPRRHLTPWPTHSSPSSLGPLRIDNLTTYRDAGELPQLVARLWRRVDSKEAGARPARVHAPARDNADRHRLRQGTNGGELAS